MILAQIIPLPSTVMPNWMAVVMNLMLCGLALLLIWLIVWWNRPQPPPRTNVDEAAMMARRLDPKMMYCPAHGVWPDGGTFCPICGAAMKDKPPVCSNCTRTLEPSNSSYCRHCGERVAR